MTTKLNEVYRLTEKRALPECGGTACIYEHRKTGAHIFTIHNQDKNKTFYIAFRTKPADDTGVAHILEHSVLCGSEKYPLKDPFVELAKGSLNTFLNAMTYPDKTVYPVASCNDTDFQNLMDVYLDAVFHPNICREKKIFEQEGWHLEAAEDGSLTYNGVVYSEMKGAFSNPESVLERSTMHALFPDTPYGFESGGEPDAIPTLTYEDFLKFHQTFYHPSNSYIYLYGDLDMEEKLFWLDRQYLSAYNREEIDSVFLPQTPAAEPKREEIFYPLGENEEEKGHCYLSENYIVPGELDAALYIAGQILSFILLDAPGAPLKEALQKAGIGEDIFGGYTSGILEPYFSVIAKNADKEDEARFHEVIRSCLEKLAKGLDPKAVQAAVNFTEFKYREADYGRIPTGLMLGLIALDSWLYGGKPYLHLAYEESFAFLKREMNNGFFEGLIRTWLLDNKNAAYVNALPKKGLAEEREQALRKKLAAYRDSLSEESLSAIRTEEEALRRYQEEPDTKEAMEKLPVLSVSDIDPQAEKIPMRVSDGGRMLWSPFRTSGISYIRVMFDTSACTEEELQYLSFLRYLYGEIDTELHNYAALGSEILLHTGGIDFDLVAYPDSKDMSRYLGYFCAELRVLAGNTEKGLALVSEMMNRSLFTDEEHIGEKLLEAKSRMQMKLDNSAHMTAVVRASSYFRADRRYADLVDGIAFYDFLNGVSKFYSIPAKRRHFLSALSACAKKVFVRKNMRIAIAGERDEKKRLCAALPAFRQSFPAAKAVRYRTKAEEDAARRHAVKPLGRLNEGFRTTYRVNYVARCGRYRSDQLPYTGAFGVLRGFLNYGYLWQNLRVKGGAYGCMSSFYRSGWGVFVSYRDPQLKKTIETYEALPEYLEKLELSDRDVTKYIIGAIASLDQPLSCSPRAAKYLSAYLCHVTDADLQRERDEILSCTAETIRAFSAAMRDILADGYLCVIGSAQEIDAQQDRFLSIRDLY